jgi:hypothetical protein
MAATSSTYLYRILGFRHVVDLLESKELHFVSPSQWEDPYERILVHKRSHAIFAQCWSKKAASDAMWRIYSADRTAVRIRTTRAKLQRELLRHKESSEVDFLIGDVEYLPSMEVNSRIAAVATDLKQRYQSRRAADALLAKREAFDHEAEVRVIIHDRRLKERTKPKLLYRLPVFTEGLVDSIFFDPRADDAFVKMATYYLENSLRFKGTISKSALYRVREPIIV